MSILGLAISSVGEFVYNPSEYAISIDNTPNTTGDPYLDRDFVAVSGVGAIGINEGYSDTFPLYARVSQILGPLVVGDAGVRYSITLVGFGNPTGDGGDVESGSVTPEPNSLVLALSGILIILLAYGIRVLTRRHTSSQKDFPHPHNHLPA